MLLTNLMFRNVVCTHDSLRVSGSENSNGPEKLPFVQSVDVAPTKPSKIDPWEKLRFRSTPQLLRAAGSVSLLGNRGVLAVVGQVRAAVRVIQRMRGAVAVDLRDDEDVQPVDERGRLRVAPVVAQEPLRGLEADARGRDLVAVLLAVEEDADLRTVTVLADPQHPLVLRPARERRRRAQQVAQRRDRACHDHAVAGRGAVQRRRRHVGERRVGVERGDDLRRRAGDRARGVGGQADADRVAGHADAQRRVRGAGVDQLRRQVVAAEMAVGLRGQHDRAGLLGRGRSGACDRQVVGVEPHVRRGRVRRIRVRVLRRRLVDVAQHRLGLALVAARLLGQLDGLRDVRELGREVAHLLVRLLRVVVVRHEARVEARARRGRVRGDPLADVERVDVAVGGRDLDARRKHGAVALVADPEDLVVVLVVVREDAGVDEGPEVAAAEPVAGRVVPLGDERRAGVVAVVVVGVGTGDLGLRRVALDRQEAPDVVLVVVRTLRPHGARRGARAAPAGGVLRPARAGPPAGRRSSSRARHGCGRSRCCRRSSPRARSRASSGWRAVRRSTHALTSAPPSAVSSIA